MNGVGRRVGGWLIREQKSESRVGKMEIFTELNSNDAPILIFD